MEKIECGKRIHIDDDERHAAVIYIPEAVLEKRRGKGLVIYLHPFGVARNVLNFRPNGEDKLSFYGKAEDAGVGVKDYNSGYVEAAVVMPKGELSAVLKELMQE